ncbi:hypothetical protein HGRIS_013263 [Hohenbuehelia grisea]|uniref:Telomere-associated protein Rif1 N-terminal domain-containing protein n=1 Tax=Hohenbuehelia grisea TaxID=104357 RepID=A0ABR3IV28_9AGAR
MPPSESTAAFKLSDALKPDISLLNKAALTANAKTETHTAVDHLKSCLVLLNSTSLSMQAMQKLQSVFRSPMVPLYSAFPELALSFCSKVYSLIQRGRISSLSNGAQEKRQPWEALQIALISGVLDFLEGDRTDKNQSTTATVLLPILCKSHFPAASESAAPLPSANLLSTVCMLLMESVTAHPGNQEKFRDSRVLGGRRLGMAISRSRDFLALESLLNLFAVLLPPTHNSTSGRAKRTAFIRDVFNSDSPRLFPCGDELVQILQNVASSQWEVTSMKIIDVLATSDMAFPQPFELTQIKACGITFLQPNAVDRLYLDTKSFFTNVDEAEAYETFQALYTHVSSVRLSNAASKNVSVVVRLTSPPVVGDAPLAPPMNGSPLLLEFEIKPSDAQRFIASLIHRGVNTHCISTTTASTKLSLAEVGSLEFHDTIPAPIAANQSYEMRDVFEEEQSDSIFSSDSLQKSLTAQAPGSVSGPVTKRNEANGPETGNHCPLPSYEDVFGTSDDHLSDLSEPESVAFLTKKFIPRGNATTRKKKRKVVISDDESQHEKKGGPPQVPEDAIPDNAVTVMSPVSWSPNNETLVHITKTFRDPNRSFKLGIPPNKVLESSMKTTPSLTTHSDDSVPLKPRQTLDIDSQGLDLAKSSKVSPTLGHPSDDDDEDAVLKPLRKRGRPRKVDTVNLHEKDLSVRPHKRNKHETQTTSETNAEDLVTNTVTFAEPTRRNKPTGKRYARKGRTSSPAPSSPTKVDFDELPKDVAAKSSGDTTRRRALAMKGKNGKQAAVSKTIIPAKPPGVDLPRKESPEHILLGMEIDPPAKVQAKSERKVAPEVKAPALPKKPKPKRAAPKAKTSPWDDPGFVQNIGAITHSDDVSNGTSFKNDTLPGSSDIVLVPSMSTEAVTDDAGPVYEEYFVRVKDETSSALLYSEPPSTQAKSPITIDLTGDSPLQAAPPPKTKARPQPALRLSLGPKMKTEVQSPSLLPRAAKPTEMKYGQPITGERVKRQESVIPSLKEGETSRARISLVPDPAGLRQELEVASPSHVELMTEGRSVELCSPPPPRERQKLMVVDVLPKRQGFNKLARRNEETRAYGHKDLQQSPINRNPGMEDVVHVLSDIQEVCAQFGSSLHFSFHI